MVFGRLRRVERMVSVAACLCLAGALPLLGWITSRSALTTDPMAYGVRGSRKVLETIDPTSIRANGYSYLIEMLYNVQRAGFTVGETPIIFADRRLGQSKISRNEILKAVYTCSRLLARRLRGSPKRLDRVNTEIVRSK